MKYSIKLLSIFSLSAASAVSAQTIAITDATVHTVGPAGTLENATVVIENGRIAEVGTGAEVPDGSILINASGKIVTPGIFSPMGQLGLNEVRLVAGTNVRLVAGTNDAMQRGDDFSAGFDVADAYNRRSTLIRITRIEGVTRGRMRKATRVVCCPVWHPSCNWGTKAII
jgi:hypothetical protein